MVEPAVLEKAFGKYGRWYVLFLVWAASTLLASFSALEGLRLLLKLTYPFMFFIVVAGMVEREEQLDRLMNCLLSASVVIVAINPLFLFGFAYTVDDSGYKRIGGLGTYANPFSFYLMVVLLISFGRFISRGQVRYLVLCAILGVWIYLTMTRITLLAMFAGIGAMMIYAALQRQNYRALVGGLLVAVLIGLPVLPGVLERSLGFVPTPNELIAIVRSPARFYESVNWQGRQVLWPTVYQAFQADRLTGLGLGSSTVVLRQNFSSSVGHLVHNEYLRLWSETGLIGVALFFTAIMSWLAGIWRAGWTASRQAREFALPAIGAVVGWAIVSLTDNAFDYYPSFTQYVGFLCGGALAAERLARSKYTDSALAST